MDVLATLYSTYFLREGKNTTQRWNLIVIALKWNRQERVLPLHVVSLTNDYLCSFIIILGRLPELAADTLPLISYSF